jgi:hypothetical protein
MKKIILTTLIILISFISYSQTQYPIIKEENGEKVLVLTIKQANILASKVELLELYENYFEERNDFDKLLIEVIDKQNNIIYDQDISISLLNDNILTKDEKIRILIQQLELMENIPTDVLVVKDDKLEKKLKRQKIISGSLGVLVIILLIL